MMSEEKLKQIIQEAFDAGVEAQSEQCGGLIFPVEKETRDEYVEKVMESV